MALSPLHLITLGGSLSPILSYEKAPVRRDQEPNIDWYEDSVYISRIKSNAEADIPKCFSRIIPTAGWAVGTGLKAPGKEPACNGLVEHNERVTEQCSPRNFEDEFLGSSKCVCDLIKAGLREEKVKLVEECANAVCMGEEVDKVKELQQIVIDMEEILCGQMKDSAKIHRDGGTLKLVGGTTTHFGLVAPNPISYPSTAFDFITTDTYIWPKLTRTDAPAPANTQNAKGEVKDEGSSRPTGGSPGAKDEDDVPNRAATFGAKQLLAVGFAFLPVIAAMAL